MDKYSMYYKDAENFKIYILLDHIAIPSNRIPATEHWGVITYRENSLLYNLRKTDTNRKHGIASVISHELAHQVREV